MSEIIKKVKCPLCGETHDVDQQAEMDTMEIKGENITFEKVWYICPRLSANPDIPSRFETKALSLLNVLRANNTYRFAHGLLTSDEIVAIREEYGLTQIDMARLLGWGEATISRYESKYIQDLSYDNIIRMIRDNPIKALEYLNTNKDKFTPEKFARIHDRMEAKYQAKGREYLVREALNGFYFDYMEPSDQNGRMVLDIDKLEAIISYIAERSEKIFKTKLMKMLWYADALCYKRTDKAMTGLVYRRVSLGALPLGHSLIMSLPNLNVIEKEGTHYDAIYQILPSEKADYKLINLREKLVLDNVIRQFEDAKTVDIVDCIKSEQAFKESAEGDIIPFSLAARIKTL